ncbi:MAG TPA: hypothetical protein VM266_11125 [Solirubrobacteraceae bacterium]|nr:hypothetical protein [Solirubrobacteraceae bacterium]
MSAVRLAALVAAALAWPAAGAHAREPAPMLVAQLAQVPEAESDLPVLTEDPPESLGRDGEEDRDDGDRAGERELADTGSDAALLGLAGASLLGLGLSLRLRLRDAA